MDAFDSTFIRLVGIFFLLGFSGFFSSCEAALFSLNPLQINTLKEKKGKAGFLVHQLLQKPKELLVTIYIGNEVVNVAISALITSISYSIFGSLGVSIAIGLGTFFLLLFGEIIPKTLAIQHAENYSLIVAYPLNWFSSAVRPFEKLLVNISELVIKKLGLETHEENNPVISDDEIKTMVDLGGTEGGLEEGESRMIQNVIRFGETTAAEIMTPKIEMFTLHSQETLDEILPKIIKNFYSRVPVYEEEGEEIKGILYTKDLNRLKSLSPENFKLKNFLHEALFIPQSKKIKELLQDFKNQKRHIAIVLDEFGSVCGLVTMEDILEELVGEIDSEMRSEEQPIVKISQNQYRLSGTLTLAELNKNIATQLSEDQFDTIGGMVFGLFGRIPRSGEAVTHEHFKFQVEKMKGSRIFKVILTVIELEPHTPNEDNLVITQNTNSE